MRASHHQGGNKGLPCSPVPLSHWVCLTSDIPHQSLHRHPNCFPFSPLALQRGVKPTRLIKGLRPQEGLFGRPPNWLKHGFLSEPRALASCVDSRGEVLVLQRKCPHCLLSSSTALPSLLDQAPPTVSGNLSHAVHYNPPPGDRPQHSAWPGSVPVNIHSFLPHPQKNLAGRPGALTNVVSCSPGPLVSSSELCWGPEKGLDRMMRLINRLKKATQPWLIPTN